MKLTCNSFETPWKQPRNYPDAPLKPPKDAVGAPLGHHCNAPENNFSFRSIECSKLIKMTLSRDTNVTLPILELLMAEKKSNNNCDSTYPCYYRYASRNASVTCTFLDVHTLPFLSCLLAKNEVMRLCGLLCRKRF